ncbi:double-strand break repair helicase AddA [Arvimicrobium flavum]|uniref:double-strand break repair helicase AddA n=1 Tax=Arvimicrobium flavum TaxID=3393320 RepID=UPI00237B3F5C|nr:double-strand break repair helicase AddA [Mesorhizobium shangrilense]
MKRTVRIPDETRADQARAADPSSSAWVSANAGSGKTHVLTQRVVRLLLRGADPSKILCLTYTRAAAANMSNRVFKTLAAWTTMPDRALAEQIRQLEDEKPDAAKIAAARRLFARALETPGGLKIQTIHAFCESVLHQFPLEANIAAHFELLDPKMEAALVESVRREMLTGAGAANNPELERAFATVLKHGGEHGLEKLLREIVAKRDGLRAFIDAVKIDETPYLRLFEALGFRPRDSSESIAASIWPLPGFAADFFRDFAQVAEAADARTVINSILPHASAAFAESDPVLRLTLLKQGFLKANGEPYDAAKAFKKAMHQQLPDLAERYMSAADAIVVACDRVALFRMLEATCAALDLADWMIARYERVKSARGMLDFNDLITRTLRLLARRNAGAWVQFKLDKGIDHILLDEAQDTSPDQWEVVKGLTEEFFAGEGARGVRRTIFAVGDEKQSIYSFQGARPESFAETKHHFAPRVRGADGRFADVRLNWSFRSTIDVLSAVDVVFGNDDARRGLTRDGEPIAHSAIRELTPGYVELWPSLGVEQVDDPDDWSTPIDHASAPAVRLAETVAATIERWINNGEIIEGTGKALTAGDVLVLVRKRDSFMHALSRSLKNRDIPVAGADRLLLPGHIAVKDLMALGRLLLQPEDDLSLAAVLRSPLFGVTEEKLFDLSWGRGKRSLRASLRDMAREDATLAAIAEQLDAWANEAAYKPVFEFYSCVLGRDGVRRKMIGRLGHEAGEILDEFLSFCLAEERAGLPGLEAFLATLEGSALEVKREMDQTRNEVRIMTVHASKGLEAPVVFLIDSGSASFTNQHMPSLMPFAFKDDLGSAKAYLWYPGSDVANSTVRAIQTDIAAAADDEYRRLLYVGMTRAEDRLIVCGYHGRRPPASGTWHSIVSRALEGASETRQIDRDSEGDTILRYRVAPVVMAHAPERETSGRQAELQLLPPGLFEPLPPDEKLPRPLTPSGASVLIDEELATHREAAGRSPVLDSDGGASFAIARGLASHRLLQMLPSLPEAERETAARRYLDRVAADWPAGEAERSLASVMGILGSRAFSPIFAENSRAEVSVMGTLMVRGQERAVSGTIDRLAVTADEVLIVDYKTNRPPPASIDQAPEAYVLQMALYAVLLKPLYPNRKISAALLFTETPKLIEVPAVVMDAALARLTRP